MSNANALTEGTCPRGCGLDHGSNRDEREVNLRACADALSAKLATMTKRAEEAEREPTKRIAGCNHTRKRMNEWIDEGACPICLTASAGMANARCLAAEAKLATAVAGLRLSMKNDACIFADSDPPSTCAYHEERAPGVDPDLPCAYCAAERTLRALGILTFTSAEIYLKALDVARAEERAAVVRYLRVWANSNRENEAIDGRLQALVTDTHADNIERGEHLNRPAVDAAALAAARKETR